MSIMDARGHGIEPSTLRLRFVLRHNEKPSSESRPAPRRLGGCHRSGRPGPLPVLVFRSEQAGVDGEQA
jgi:hypothetical protein